MTTTETIEGRAVNADLLSGIERSISLLGEQPHEIQEVMDPALYLAQLAVQSPDLETAVQMAAEAYAKSREVPKASLTEQQFKLLAVARSTLQMVEWTLRGRLDSLIGQWE